MLIIYSIVRKTKTLSIHTAADSVCTNRVESLSELWLWKLLKTLSKQYYYTHCFKKTGSKQLWVHSFLKFNISNNSQKIRACRRTLCITWKYCYRKMNKWINTILIIVAKLCKVDDAIKQEWIWPCGAQLWSSSLL